jgi:hypothetical protein
MLETEIDTNIIYPKISAKDIAKYNKDIDEAMIEINKGKFYNT